ncbi:uncharacterized protein LOC115230167 [Octopus sinensis]|uniref:Uncharacterized protein LOC115230167 n=1 Tax=Octopus sinensis TaxID=2607531 RepID=A0A7E6EII9_9MOLL|nr:uncharacterized protein LOC115230167 [Octopus sinensis]
MFGSQKQSLAYCNNPELHCSGKAKVCCKSVIPSIGEQLQPIQLGVGVPGGCESSVHACRCFIHGSTRSNISLALLKLDVTNAFNSLDRGHMLEVCQDRVPHLLPFISLSYSLPSLLIAGGSFISSSCGVQQGDPLGPLLFALAVDAIARVNESPLNLWYLDDCTLGGPPDVLLKDLASLIPALSDIGLVINSSKSEIVNLSVEPSLFKNSFSLFCKLLPELRQTPLSDLEILGSPILADSATRILLAKKNLIASLCEKLSVIDSHPSFYILKNYLLIPKIVYILRSSPCFYATQMLESYDSLVRRSAEKILNVHFDDIAWCQAKLPVSHGGLGLRSSMDLALPAFLSSASGSYLLIQKILEKTTESSLDSDIDSALALWKRNFSEVPSDVFSQRDWDKILCRRSSTDLEPLLDQHRLACFRSACQPYSGSWLNVLPSPLLDTVLDRDSLRLGICNRLGLPVCRPHPCRCGDKVDAFGLHPLSCRMSPGRFPRHTEINNLIHKALERAGFPSILEPTGLVLEDAKRPDGCTLFAFESGKQLVWDVTCSDSFAKGALNATACRPGSSAEMAEFTKLTKYDDLRDRFCFWAIAVETSCIVSEQFSDIARVRNCIIALTRHKMPVFDTAVDMAYDISAEFAVFCFI